MYKLNGATGDKTGLGITLKVMVGDNVAIYGKSYWHSSSPSNTGHDISISTLLTQLANTSAVANGGKGATAAALTGSSVTPADVSNWLSGNAPSPGTKPKAYINWILFDEQFRVVNSSSGFSLVGSADAITTHSGLNVSIVKNGYLYVYCSNESDQDVFFDNLQVMHTRGPLLEETHYYPFGLTMAGISSKAAGKVENRYKYNKGSELQHQEFSDGSGLELYATQLRQLDPQLGRWWQIDSKPDYSQSLYSAMGNNPILYNDPLGDSLPRPPSANTNILAPTNWYGVAATKASNVRTQYTTNSGKIDKESPSAKQERVNLQEKARANTPEPFNSVVESGRPMQGEYAKLDNPNINNPTKTNVEVNETMKTTGALGRAFIIGGVLNSGVNIATAQNPASQVVIEGGAWAGALQGGTTGATVGSLGGPVGAFLGGLGGSVLGGIAGSKFAQWLVQNGTVGDDRHNGFVINGAFIPNNVLDKR